MDIQTELRVWVEADMRYEYTLRESCWKDAFKEFVVVDTVENVHFWLPKL
jgi:hypothetical protein